jgi:predicted RNA-binding protein associated with RNAse of E/G family
VPIVLDEDELQDALSRNWISADQADAARREVTRIVEMSTSGAWPPPVVHTWTLERARGVTRA